MADETSKQMLRRSSDHRFATRWLVGRGIDIGCGPDPLSKLAHFLPLMQHVRPWDLPDGDAMLMEGVDDATFDFVHSSHCLEHLVDPRRALHHWVRICRPGGHLVVTVPDEDMYEQGFWPSRFNGDHKWTFTILKRASWSPRSLNVVELLNELADEVEVLKIERLDAGFDPNAPLHDQTRNGVAECAIEFVLRRRPPTTAPSSRTTDAGSQAAPTSTYAEHARAAEALQAAQRLDDARARLESPSAVAATAASPADDLDRRFRLARLCEWLGRDRDAERHLRGIVAQQPAHALAHAHLGFLAMKRGDFAQGVAELDWLYRGRVPASQLGLFVAPDGTPRPMHGRTVVLAADAGLGDTLMFVRYAIALKAAGARVVVECQPALHRLVARMPAVDEVVAPGRPPAVFDHRVPLHSLPGAFRTRLETVPAPGAYLVADAAASDAFARRLATLPGRKVGIVWSGDPKHVRNAARSMPPAAWAPWRDVPGVTWVSLQKGAQDAPAGLVDWTDELDDMDDTAALVAGLDLVVAVDSAVAHLAGALGRPVWVANRFDGCWRWLEDRDDSPWYPTLRLFRQTTAADWSPVVARLASALASWVDAGAPTEPEAAALAA